MGLRGKAPSPSAIQAAKGGPRRDTGIVEPEPAEGMPARPDGLSVAAIAVWTAIESVVAPGVITQDNGQALSRYCHMLVRWWKLAKWLDENEEIYEVQDKEGNVRYLRHPNLISYEKLTQAILRQEQEFGLTPASRTRIHALVAGTQSKPKPTTGEPTLRIAQ